jgi:hypothetical protein
LDKLEKKHKGTVEEKDEKIRTLTEMHNATLEKKKAYYEEKR